MSDYIKSPINYTGSKYRLIKKGLLDYFPSDINTFVDLFCGACNVGVNVHANKIICNDYINYLIDLFNVWKNKSLVDINRYIDDTIVKFNLSPTNNESFIQFRQYYNKNRNVEDLFILLCYSFNYQIRFNNSQEYNSSFGKEASTMNDSIRKNLNIFINTIKEKDINFINNDFRELKIDKLSSNDFVYLAPPYSLSRGVYQDGKRGFKGWSVQDDMDLFDLCDRLNRNNIKFALSNVLGSRGVENSKLIEWSKKYNVINLNMQYNNANYQRKDKGRDVEVLITDY